MSPTSCRCSTPRRVLASGARRLWRRARVASAVCVPGVGGARGGLASRGVAPTVLSGAALGHDRVRDGTGWGQHALGHGHPPPPARGGPERPAAPRRATPSRSLRRGSLRAAPAGRPRALHSTITRSRVSGVSRPVRRDRPSRLARDRPSRWRGPPRCRGHDAGWESMQGDPPSTIRTARLQSVARGPPAAYQPGHLPGVLPHLRVGMLVLGRDSRLDAFSGSPVRTWLPSDAASPRQLAHQRCVHPGPLVLGAAPRNLPTPVADRDRTVSRRSEPSSRTAFMGEQPNPWDLLRPQDATSRHRGAKPCRRCGLLGRISLLSPG